MQYPDRTMNRSDYVTTDSLRRRSGPNGRPIPRIVKSPAANDEPATAVNITFDDDSAIEL